MSNDPADDLAAIQLVLSLIDGERIVARPYPYLTQCQQCGAGIDPPDPGRLPWCVPCQCAELGETWPGLAHRVSHRLTLNQWRKLETVADVPQVTYKTWRRRHFTG